MSARQLTDRDLDYIRRTALSATRKQIAAAWGRRLKTVDWRAVSVAEKLGVSASDVAALTRYAIGKGMIKL